MYLEKDLLNMYDRMLESFPFGSEIIKGIEGAAGTGTILDSDMFISGLILTAIMGVGGLMFLQLVLSLLPKSIKSISLVFVAVGLMFLVESPEIIIEVTQGIELQEIIKTNQVSFN